jgi:hypothetical protein
VGCGQGRQEHREARRELRGGRERDAGLFSQDFADGELWAYFGSAEAVNDALRRVVSERKKASGS